MTTTTSRNPAEEKFSQDFMTRTRKEGQVIKEDWWKVRHLLTQQEKAEISNLPMRSRRFNPDDQAPD